MDPIGKKTSEQQKSAQRSRHRRPSYLQGRCMKGRRKGCRWSSGRCHVGRTIWKTLLTIKGLFWFFQENLQHIPRAPVRQLKGIPLQPGGIQVWYVPKGVLKQA